MTKNKKYSKDEKKLFREIFWNSFLLENSYNYERQQALGFAVGMWPIIKRVYKDKKSQGKALVRHMQIFNTTPHMVTVITGVASAMEKKASENEEFDTNTINSVKVALMGPFAGIGDSFFWGTIRIIATALALPLSQQGSILGPILFLIAFNVPHLLFRYYGGVLGYSFGSSLLTDISESAIFNKISKGATIVGLMVIGAMSAQMVDMSTPLAFNFGETEILIQDFLDQIFPQLLPLLYTLLMYWLLAVKKKSSASLVLVTVIVGLVGGVLGIL